MRQVESRHGFSPRLRLQFVLLLLIAWDAFGLVAELTFGGPLFKISGDKISGLIGARGALGGSLAVPLVLYLYALVKGPARYRGLIWVGAIEQAAGALFAVYHLARHDIRFEAAIVPLAVSLVLLALVFLNMPREQTTT
jgi:hypothetical protein